MSNLEVDPQDEKSVTTSERKIRKAKKSKKSKSNGNAMRTDVDDKENNEVSNSESRPAKQVLNGTEPRTNEADSHSSREKAEDEEARSRRKEEKRKAKAARKAEKAELKATKKARKEAKIEADTDGSKSTIAKSVTKHDQPQPEPGTTDAGYTEQPGLSALSQDTIDSFLKDQAISVKDPSSDKHLRPITAFSYLPRIAGLKQDIFASFTAPTPIQAAAWPYLLSGRDTVGIAETGSGKTLAFAIPCIRHILGLQSAGNGKAKGSCAAMVSPTRELALQIYEQVDKLAGPAGLKAVCVYGGVSKDEQRKTLRGANIVVATPGRLNDFINEGSIDLSQVSYVVLDEADRMLDKGFEEEVRKIIKSTKQGSRRQTLMFTATWPPSVRDLANDFLSKPVHISIGADNPTNELRANARILQKVEVVDPRAKEQRLLQILKQNQSGSQKDDRILVFCLYKKEAIRVESFLRSRYSSKVAGIHGDLGQASRTANLSAFKAGEVTVLVATDVAARGLDIPSVKLVVNVTFPLTVEDYVHRVGRTGRAGQEGLAITLFTEHDKAQSGALINVLKAAKQPVPDELLKFGTTVKRKGHDAYGAFYKEPSDSARKATKVKFDD